MMSAERIAELKSRRAQLARAAATLKADPALDGEELQAELEDVERMIATMDQLLRKAERGPKRTQCEPRPSAPGSHVVEVGRIKATARSAVRVCVVDKAGDRAVDIRFWFRSKDSDEMVPSRKGVRVDPSRIDALIDALQLAKQHLPSTGKADA